MLHGSIGRILRSAKSLAPSRSPRRRAARIAVEPLEDRRLLSAAAVLPQVASVVTAPPRPLGVMATAQYSTILPGETRGANSIATATSTAMTDRAAVNDDDHGIDLLAANRAIVAARSIALSPRVSSPTQPRTLDADALAALDRVADYTTVLDLRPVTGPAVARPTTTRPSTPATVLPPTPPSQTIFTTNLSVDVPRVPPPNNTAPTRAPQPHTQNIVIPPVLRQAEDVDVAAHHANHKGRAHVAAVHNADAQPATRHKPAAEANEQPPTAEPSKDGSVAIDPNQSPHASSAEAAPTKELRLGEESATCESLDETSPDDALLAAAVAKGAQSKPLAAGVDALLSEAYAALAEEVSTDLVAVDAALSELLVEIDDLGGDVVRSLTQIGVAPWMVVAAAGAAAYEHRRRQRAHDRSNAADKAPLELFPELFGLAPGGER